MTDGTPDIGATAAYIANYLKRSFKMCERDDLIQEQMAWVASHAEKIEQWSLEGKIGERKLAKAMRHAALRLAQKEKAAHLGYEVSDLYYYELGLIKDTLAILWNDEAKCSPPKPAEETKVKHRAPAEGNNYVATIADVGRAVSNLSEPDRAFLLAKHRDGYSDKELAEMLDLTVSAVRSKYARLVKRIQTLLGGERPR